MMQSVILILHDFRILFFFFFKRLILLIAAIYWYFSCFVAKTIHLCLHSAAYGSHLVRG